MERKHSFNLDNYYRRLTSDCALSQIEKLLKEQNLVGYIEGYLNAREFSASIKDDEKKEFYNKLYHIYEEEKNRNLSLPDLKALSREYIDSYLSERTKKEDR